MNNLTIKHHKIAITKKETQELKFKDLNVGDLFVWCKDSVGIVTSQSTTTTHGLWNCNGNWIIGAWMNYESVEKVVCSKLEVEVL